MQRNLELLISNLEIFFEHLERSDVKTPSNVWQFVRGKKSNLRTLEPGAVERGADLFGSSTSTAQNGNCVACHGGAGWTVSKLTFTPSSAKNEQLSSAAFKSPFTGAFATLNFNTTQLGNQAPVTDTTTGPAEPKAVGPKQVSV